MNFDNWLCKQTGHWANFSIQTLKLHREIETCVQKFQITSTTESEDREVGSFTKSHTNLLFITGS